MLGTVVRDHDSFVIADIPGLIEGASEGKGLGDRFLGHIERCAALIHLVDGTQDDVVGAWRTIRAELEAYGHGLAEKTEILCLIQDRRAGRREALASPAAELEAAAGRPVHAISAVARRGLGPVLPRRPGCSSLERRRERRPRRRRDAGGRRARRPARRRQGRLARCWSSEDGQVRAAWLDGLAADVARAARPRPAGDHRHLGRHRARPAARSACRAGRCASSEKQAAAAAGQIILAHAWQESLGRVGLDAAQILITLEDTEARRRYLNARATIDTLLRLGVVPVVNENDTVATTEIRFGDNDRLSARVAVMASAETLVLLSDVDGLYTADPRRDPEAAPPARRRGDHARDRGDGRRRRAARSAPAAW